MVCGNGRMMIRFLIGLWILMSSILVHACDFDHQIESIERKIKKPRKILDNNSLDDVEVVKRHLTIMYAVDQEVRKLFIVFDNPTTRKLLTEVDFFHTEHLKAILAIHGWISSCQNLAKKLIIKLGSLFSILIMILSFKNAVSCYCSTYIPVERQIRKIMLTHLVIS